VRRTCESLNILGKSPVYDAEEEEEKSIRHSHPPLPPYMVMMKKRGEKDVLLLPFAFAETGNNSHGH